MATGFYLLYGATGGTSHKSGPFTTEDEAMDAINDNMQAGDQACFVVGPMEEANIPVASVTVFVGGAAREPGLGEPGYGDFVERQRKRQEQKDSVEQRPGQGQQPGQQPGQVPSQGGHPPGASPEEEPDKGRPNPRRPRDNT